MQKTRDDSRSQAIILKKKRSLDLFSFFFLYINDFIGNLKHTKNLQFNH